MNLFHWHSGVSMIHARRVLKFIEMSHVNYYYHLRFEDFTAVTMKNAVSGIWRRVDLV
jgi:hypothetical protein